MTPHVLTHLERSLLACVPLVIPASLKHTLHTEVPHNLYCVSAYQHHKLFPPSRLRRPSCARGSKGQRRRNAISPTAAAVLPTVRDQSRCRPALPGTLTNKTVSGCSANTRTHCPVRSEIYRSVEQFPFDARSSRVQSSYELYWNLRTSNRIWLDRVPPLSLSQITGASVTVRGTALPSLRPTSGQRVL
jgi:hypothetical protein